MAYAMIILVILIALLSPAILGALFHLVCRNTHVDSLSIAIGFFFALVTAAFSGGDTSVIDLVDRFKENGMQPGTLNAIVVFMVAMQIGIYAAIASLGIRLTDKLRGSQHHPAPYPEPRTVQER
jgi:hypothetical protein